MAEWLQFMDMNLRFADEPVVRYFRHILMMESDVPEVPTLYPHSEILNQEMVCLMYLSNGFINHINKPLILLHSSSKHGNKLSNLTDSLQDYNGELIWIFKHISSDEDKKRGLPSIAIFGAFTGTVPQMKSGADTSDKECYLFSLVPTFKVLYQIKYTNMICNNYMNSAEGFKKGIGFARNENTKNFRLWIGDTFNQGSSITNAPDVFTDAK